MDNKTIILQSYDRDDKQSATTNGKDAWDAEFNYENPLKNDPFANMWGYHW